MHMPRAIMHGSGMVRLPLPPAALMLPGMRDRKKFDVNEISDLVVAGVRRAWAEKEPVLLIGLLAGAVMVAVFWPAVRLNFAAMQIAGSADPALAQAFLQRAAALWPLYLLMLLFNSAVMVAVARLATEGRSQVLTGGIPALGRRLVWLLWRSLCAIGWFVVGAVALWLTAMIVWAPLSLLTGGGAGSFPAMLVEGVFVALLATGILFLCAAVGLALISECADHHLPIRRAWRLLKGQRLKLAVAIFTIYLGTALINGLLLVMTPKNSGSLEEMRLTLSLLHVIVTMVGTFFTYLWFAMTAIAGEKIDWSEPEPEPEPKTDDPEI